MVHQTYEFKISLWLWIGSVLQTILFSSFFDLGKLNLRGWGVSLIINTQTKLVIYIYINLVAVLMLNLYHSKLRSADPKIAIHSVVTHFQSLIELQPNKVWKYND